MKKNILSIAAIVLVSGLTSSFATRAAMADQSNMVNAKTALQSAYGYLQHAVPDKGGHRGEAMKLVTRAINQVNAGITYANMHGG